MKKIHLFALLLTFFAQLSCAASFDCAKAGTTVEKLICSNESLSKLDEELAVSYKQALETATDKDIFKKQQLNWLKTRNTCADSACVTSNYKNQIKQMNSYIQQYPQRMDMEKEIKALAYKPNYKRIDIKKAFADGYSMNKVRPANMFQIVASAHDKLCGDVLIVLNQAGTYQGLDQVYWWVSNVNLAKWNILKQGYPDENIAAENYTHSRIEELEADIDGDGSVEYAYRAQGSLSSNFYQNIAVFNTDLKNDSSMDELYLTWECGSSLKSDCEKSKIYFNQKIETKIWRFIASPSAPLKNRWKSMAAENGFVEDFYGHNKDFSMYEHSWWSTLISANKSYGIILYPQIVTQFEIMYGTLSKDKPINHQCIFAPKITKH